MIIYGQDAETLEKLGLSPSEAKVYLSNLKSGIATAKIIAKNADIGREEVYRILPALQELGLIKKHFDSPAKYEATSPCEAMKILLTSRDQESEYLKSQADEFLKNCSDNGEPIYNKEVKTVMVSRDNSSGVDIELMKLVRKTKNAFDFTTRQKLFSVAFNERGLTDWINEMYLAAERGVKFRMIIDGPINYESWSEIEFSIPNSNRLLKHSNFDFRYISSPPECIMILFDNQASCIETSCQKETKMSPYMITNNPVFSALSKHILSYYGITESRKNNGTKKFKTKRKRKT